MEENNIAKCQLLVVNMKDMSQQAILNLVKFAQKCGFILGKIGQSREEKTSLTFNVNFLFEYNPNAINKGEFCFVCSDEPSIEIKTGGILYLNLSSSKEMIYEILYLFYKTNYPLKQIKYFI
jgi:hypothetical protein